MQKWRATGEVAGWRRCRVGRPCAPFRRTAVHRRAIGTFIATGHDRGTGAAGRADPRPIAGTHERPRGEPSQPDSDGPSDFPTSTERPRPTFYGEGRASLRNEDVIEIESAGRRCGVCRSGRGWRRFEVGARPGVRRSYCAVAAVPALGTIRRWEASRRRRWSPLLLWLSRSRRRTGARGTAGPISVRIA